MDDATKLINKLFTVGETLSSSLRERILALGAAAEPHLIALIANDDLFDVRARGRGCVPLHALELLGALRAVAAIPRMIEIVQNADVFDAAHDAAMFALTAIGAPALEPCLAAYDATDDEELQSALGNVLAELHVRDERVFKLLVEQFEREPALGAGYLVEYGDARALPLIARALDELELSELDLDDRVLANHDLSELGWAIEELGGQLTDPQRKRVERARAEMRVRARSPGRNEPCHCGSGKKYKTCHLAADEELADSTD